MKPRWAVLALSSSSSSVSYSRSTFDALRSSDIAVVTWWLTNIGSAATVDMTRTIAAAASLILDSNVICSGKGHQ
jgi:hypothetical protein